MKNTITKKLLSAVLSAIILLSFLPLIAVNSSAAMPGNIDGFINVTSDKIKELSKKATTDGLISKLTNYHWVGGPDSWAYYKISNNKLCVKKRSNGELSSSDSYTKNSNASISINDYSDHRIVDIGFNDILLSYWKSGSYTYVSFLFKENISNENSKNYRDYKNCKFISPYLFEKGCNYIQFGEKSINTSPSSFSFYPTSYEPAANNCCRDADYTEDDVIPFYLIKQENRYFALYSLYPSYILEEWTKYTPETGNEWYAESVKYVTQKGYMAGYSNGQFGPNDNLKRQDFVLILARIAGANLSRYENTATKFSDTKKGAYYYSAVNWAVENGIIGGYANGKFGVNDPITREQVATILYRYQGSPYAANPNSTLSKFSDVKRISSYAITPLTWAVKNGIISGMADGRIAPTENATRAQIATIIMRMDQYGYFS